MTKHFLRDGLRNAIANGVSFTRNSLALIGLTLLVAAVFVLERGNLKSQPVMAVADAPGAESAGFTTSFFSSTMAPGNLSARFVPEDIETADAKTVVVPAHLELVGSKEEQVLVTRYLARKYHVNAAAADLMVSAAYLAARDASVDPALLLAVIGVESGFNPFAESVVGAQGLMQVMSKIHSNMLEDYGPQGALDPVANIRVGALILKDCIRRGGSVRDGLRLYVGSMTQDDGGYGLKVLQERDRIASAAHGGNPLIVPVAAKAVPAANDASSTSATSATRAPGDAEVADSSLAGPTDQHFAAL